MLTVPNGSSTAHFQAASPAYPGRTSIKNMPTMLPRILDNAHFTVRTQ